ncbi:MAG: iron ABC transporter permease [bacterium]
METKPAHVRTIYSKFAQRKLKYIAGEFCILFFLMMISVAVGTADLGLKEVLWTITARFIASLPKDPLYYPVIWHLRLPRVIMGVVAGAGLAASGTVMQAVTRNPLVSPFTLGISSAAALGASIAIMFNLSLMGPGKFTAIIVAFIFSLLCTLLVFALASKRGNSAEALILAGIVLMYFFSALTSVLQFFASEQELTAMVNWTFGSLSRSKWDEILIAACVVLTCIPILTRFSWDLNAMIAAGDEGAATLGINTSRIRTICLILSSLVTATIISFTGIIGFVGLVAPHLTRLVIGGDHRFLLVGSCITGAIILTLADIFGRTIVSPMIIPIGIVVSFVGVPMFIYLMMINRENYWG